MTYTESNDLMNDPVFRGRVKVAALKYADSITNEASVVPAHTSRLRWAQQCMQQPEQMANTLTPPTVMDPAVQGAGPNIDDVALQGAVEAIVNKMI